MRVRELIERLSACEQEAIADVRVEGQADGDWEIIDLEPLDIARGPNRGSWVTLTLEGER